MKIERWFMLTLLLAIPCAQSNDSGPSQHTLATATTTAKPADGKVTGLYAEYRDRTSVTLTWSPPASISPSNPIRDYQAHCVVRNNTYNYSARSPVTRYFRTVEPSSRVTGLYSQVQYACYLYTRGLAGYGVPSEPTTFWTKPAESQWSSFQMASANERQVTLTLPRLTYPYSLVGYESVLLAVQRSSRISGNLNSTAIGTNDESYITAELSLNYLQTQFTIGNNYTYAGYRNKPLHFGSYTFYIGLKPVTEEVVEFTSSSAWQVEIVLPAPTELRVVTRASTSVHLTWTPPKWTDTTDPIRGYQISCYSTNSAYNPSTDSASVPNLETVQTSQTITGLSSHVQYECRVRAKLANGYGEWSQPIPFWTKPAKSRWSSFQKATVNERQVTLTLPRLTYPPLAGYESVLLAVQSSSSISEGLTSSTIGSSDDSYITAKLPLSRLQTEFTIGGDSTYDGYLNRQLHAGNYTFYIGLKPVTEEVVEFASSSQWQVELVPAAPTGLSVGSRYSTSAILTWTPPIWTDDTYPITGYTVSCIILDRTYNPSASRYPLYLYPIQPPANLTQLYSQAQYVCYVKVKIQSGSSEWSPPLTFWTKPAELKWNFSNVEPAVDDTLITLTLPTPANLYSPAGYESMLIAVQAYSRVKRALTSTDIETSDNYYITAEFPVRTSPGNFTVGDNSTHGSYRNRPLKLGSYTFYVGLKAVTEQVVEFTAFPYQQLEIVTTELLLSPVTIRTPNSALLEWKAPQQLLESNSSIIGYEISCSVRNNTYNPTANITYQYVIVNHRSANVTSLSPHVLYRCHARAKLANGLGRWSEYKIFWTKPAAIEWRFPDKEPAVDDTLVTLTLPTPANLHSPAGYESMLIAVQKHSRVKRALSSTDIETSDNYYITAELPVVNSSEVFTVGDNNTYGSSFNRPLGLGSYTFYIGLKAVTEEVVEFSSSPNWQLEIVAPKTKQSGNLALYGGVAGGLLIFLLLAIILAIVLFRNRSRKESGKATDRQSPSLEMGPTSVGARRSRHGVEEAEEPLLADDSKDLYANLDLTAPNSNPILVSELHLVVQQAKEDDPDDPFKDEYLQIGHPNTVCNEGKKAENLRKNRFKDIMACDATRIKLAITNDSETDYIHANYVQDAKKRNRFIASQGPTELTIEDMWRMIHDTNSSTIVMLTNPVEANKVKCAIYYPESSEKGVSSEIFGRFEVRLVEEQKFAEYTVRRLKYTYRERTRAVRQFHFTTWPDHGVPTTAGLLDFRHRVKQDMVINHGPTIVHCSAGVGRTGTFIALDLLIEEAMSQSGGSEPKVDVMACVYRMRLQRPRAIQTSEQYAFLYEVLVEALSCGETAVTCAQFDERLDQWTMRNGQEKCTLELMFERSKITCSPITDDQFSTGGASENRDKNRDQSILPLESHRILLKESELNRTGYINAVVCNGYHTRNGLLVTQTPLAHTEHDFWAMLLKYESAVVVYLNNTEDEQPYWPYEQGSQSVTGDITVQCVHNIMGSEGCVESELCVIQRGKRHEVLLIELQVPEGELPDTTQLLTLCRKLERYASSSQDIITIHCSNGSRLSGLFVVAMNLFLRARIEQEVDVVLEVKLARRSRPEFIADFASFNLLHEFLTSYLAEFSEYSNFK